MSCPDSETDGTAKGARRSILDVSPKIAKIAWEAMPKPLLADHLCGAGFVRGSFRVGIEDGVGQLVNLVVVHRQENLAGLNVGSDEGSCLESASLGQDDDYVLGFNASFASVRRIDLDVKLRRVQLFQDRRL